MVIVVLERENFRPVNDYLVVEVSTDVAVLTNLIVSILKRVVFQNKN